MLDGRGARNFYDTKQPIQKMADLKGQKIRVMGNPMFVDMANSMGANGVPLGYDQVFTSLQTGVIDGAENNPPSFVFDNHYQVAKSYTVDEHLIVPEMLVMSKKILDSMSKDEQAAVRKFAREAQMEERKLWDDYEEQAMDKAKAAGIQIIQVSEPTRRLSRRGQAGVGQVRSEIRRDDQAHPGSEVTEQRLRQPCSLARTGVARQSALERPRRKMTGIYRKAMDVVYFICAVIAGTALVLISFVMPWAVFTRYVLNSAASWPETAAVLLTVVLTFFGAAACYRLGMHMNVSVGVDLLPARMRRFTDFWSKR